MATEARSCTYLGLWYDAETQSLTADARHACHRAVPPQKLALARQATCLGAAHQNCPALQPDWAGVLPEDFRQAAEPSRWKLAMQAARTGLLLRVQEFSRLDWLLIVLAALMLCAVVALMGLLAKIVFNASAARLPTDATIVTFAPTAPFSTPTKTRRLAVATQPSFAAPTATAVSEHTPTVSLSGELVHTSTLPPATPGPALETPFGPGKMFIVHKLAPGESLALLSQRYDTTEAALHALNLITPTGLWEGAVLVIVPGRHRPENLPRLQAVFVETRMRVDELADAYATSSDDLRRWNGIDGEWVEAGRWVVVYGVS